MIFCLYNFQWKTAQFSVENCNKITVIFLDICACIKFPVSLEKTEWASPQIIFLGMLLDGKTHTISISLKRRDEMLAMINRFSQKRKATIKDLQKQAGHLNFINRAVVPGRAFKRRIYAKFSGPNLLSNSGKILQQHHHVKLDHEFRMDCMMWSIFLTDLTAVNRPFLDLNKVSTASDISFYSDALPIRSMNMERY